MKRMLAHINWHMVFPTLALVLVIGFGIARMVDAATSVDYQAQVKQWGPIVPGSFHIVARGPVPGGEVVVYTVRRPHRKGLGVGSVISRGQILFRTGNISGGEGYGPISPRQHGIVAGHSQSQGVSIFYGYLLDRRIVTVVATSPDRKHEVRATVTPAHGFYMVVPPGNTKMALTFVRRDGSTVGWP